MWSPPLPLCARVEGNGANGTRAASPIPSTAMSTSSGSRTFSSIEPIHNSTSDPGAFAAAGAEEQEGGEPLPPAGVGVAQARIEGAGLAPDLHEAHPRLVVAREAVPADLRSQARPVVKKIWQESANHFSALLPAGGKPNVASVASFLRMSGL
jgi:hypothetical protein